MKKFTIEIGVDTNDYDEDGVARFNLFHLSMNTLHEWQVAGEAGRWNVEGDLYVGTKYRTEAQFSDRVLLELLLHKMIENVGVDRLMWLTINGIQVEVDPKKPLDISAIWNSIEE